MDNCRHCLMLKDVRKLKVEQIQFVDSKDNPTYCRACYQRERAENERLKEVLEEAWGVVEELVTQCASDVATGCWPARLGYSEKDVKRINKNIEQALKETQ